MRRHEISDDNWFRIEHLLPGRLGGWPRTTAGSSTRPDTWPSQDPLAGFAGAVRQVGHGLSPLQRVVQEGGLEAGVRGGAHPNLEWLRIDATVIRAHHHAAGMNGGDDDQGLGRSRGGFGTKLHLAVESLGLPPEITLSPGQDADITHPARGSPLGERVGGQGVRQRCLCEVGGGPRCGGGHSAEVESEGSAGIRRGGVQGTEQGRAVYQSIEAVPAGGDSLRENRPELPRDGPVRRDNAMASIRTGENWIAQIQSTRPSKKGTVTLHDTACSRFSQ
jgi:hypothetical protein